MKIVQVINSLSAGGAEVFTSQLSVELARQGHDVTLVTYVGIIGKKGLYLNNYLIENGVKVIHFSIGNDFYNKTIKPFFRIRNTILELKPDVIHAHLQLSDVYVAFVKLFSFRKHIIVRTLHNRRRPKRFTKSIDKFFYKIYDKNIACSDFVKENYIDKELREYMISIPNGIDLSRLDSITKSKKELRESLGIPLESAVFINIGSMYLSPPNYISKKNQQYIIDSVSAVLEDKSFLVLFLGDGTLREKLELSCKERKVEKQFRFEGNVISPYEYILAADFCLMPSLDEGLPISLIEAVCAGLYSVTSNIDAFQPFKSESVHQLKTFEISEFSEVLNKMLQNKEFYIKLGEEQKSYFRNNFGMYAVANKYISSYKDA
jgi:glycosyltransferase involved in cell wall biosynthesis